MRPHRYLQPGAEASGPWLSLPSALPHTVLTKGNEVRISVCSQEWGSTGGSVVKNPPAKQETQVQSLGQEDPLEKEMATHSSILAWEILWTEEPGRL